jgi:photosystem II stability/assembly factor-like uncharacterized protein
MRRVITKSVLALSFVLLAVCPLEAQWTRLMSLQGITLQNFEVSASGIIYALPIFGHEFYVSTNRGDSWELRNIPDSLEIWNIELAGEDLYLMASTQQSGYRLYRSTDLGRSIAEIPVRNLQPMFSCGSDGKLYAVIYTGGEQDSVFVSDDHGATWSAVAPGFYDWRYWYYEDALSIGPTGVLWGICHDSMSRFDEPTGRWVNYDAGAEEFTFTPSLYHMPNGDVYMNSWYRLLKYVAATDSIVELYDWKEGQLADIFGCFVTADGRLLVSHLSRVGTGSVISESTDDGASWHVVDSTLACTVSFQGQSGEMIFGSTEYTLMRSPDGIAFEECMSGMSTPWVIDFETRGQRIHVMGGRYALSDDGGASWSYPGTGGGFNPYGMQITSDGTIYEHRGYLRISRDSTRSWVRPYGKEINDFLALDDVVLVGVNDNTIIRSTDQGRSFSSVYRGESPASGFRQNRDVLYALTKSYLLRSSDRGATWMELPLPTGSATGYKNLVANDRVLLFTIGDEVWTSSNQGEDWAGPFSSGLDEGLVNVAVNSDGTFAGIVCRGWRDARHRLQPYQDVVLSTDDGVSWQSIGSGLPASFFTPVNFLHYSRIGFTGDNRLLVNGEHALYSFDQVPVSTNTDPAPPESPELSVWPTPAGNRVFWSVSGMEVIGVAVVSDLNGKTVAASRHASSDHGAIDISMLPEGVYFLQVHFGSVSPLEPRERTLTKRMVVLR